MVTVYDKDNCSNCRKTEELLDELGIVYETVNISHDKEALAEVKAMGYVEAPVVVTEDGSWSGHDIQKIYALAGVSDKVEETEDDDWDF